jgi:tRNA(Ile)-lysidine synthase
MMMNNEKLMHAELLKNLPKTNKYLVAVSGGMDSMALVHAMHNVGYTFQVAHCNYQLRGADSDADQELVRAFCIKYQIPFHAKRFDTMAIIGQQKVGIQEGARQIRYQYFAELCNTNQLHAVVTAHHAGDQIETILMNICRGTGLDGLTGIKVKNTIDDLLVIRPLLNLEKKNIQQYIIENNIDYREDASNAKQDYLRNQMRLSVIPAIEKADARFAKTMQNNIENWTNVNTIYQAHVSKTLNKAMSQRGQEMVLHINAFRKLAVMEQWIYEALKPYQFSYAQCQEVYKIIDAPNGKFVANEKYRVVKQNDLLIITSAEKQQSTFIIIEKSDQEVQTKDFVLQINQLQLDVKISDNTNIALLDASKIEYPLVLRKWKEGDYFYPLGMAKKKKVARFLIDNKVPLLQKEKTYVLVSGDKIIWIVGMRIDDRMKIKESTKMVLKVVLFR